MLKTWEILDAVMESDLPPPVRWIITVIGSCQNHTQGRPAFPDYETIARKAGSSVRAAKENVKLAVASGWLEVTKARGVGKKYVHNVYTIQVPDAKPSADSARSLTITEGKQSAENDINRVQILHTNNEGNNEVKNKGKVKECTGADAPVPLRSAPESCSPKKYIPNVPKNFETWAVSGGADSKAATEIWERHLCDYVPEGVDPFGKASMAKLHKTASRILGIEA